MAQIDQIQVKYVPVEDRLMLRVSTTDAAEFRFWLTRRFVGLMWPALAKSMTNTQRITTQASEGAKRELAAFEHQRAVAAADFDTPYKDVPKATPLGEEPVLLAKLQLSNNADGSLAMSIGPEQGAGIDLALNQGLLHSFSELIRNAAEIAKWDLPPLLPQQTPPPNPDNVTVN